MPQKYGDIALENGIKVFLGREALVYCEKFAGRAECRKIFQTLEKIRKLKPFQRPFPFLSGLARTGKTTMLHAAMNAIENPDTLAYISVDGVSTTKELGQYLEIFAGTTHYSTVNDFLKNQWRWEPVSPEVEDVLQTCLGGSKKWVIRHVFIDKLENVVDFTTHSKWISDIFRHGEPHIVFAGLPMTVDQCLADCFMGEGMALNMNFLSFKDWSCQEESEDIQTYLKTAGVSNLKNGLKYLGRLLHDIELAVKRNADRHGSGIGIWYALGGLFRKGHFRQAGMVLLELNTLRLLNDVLARHFEKDKAVWPLKEKILHRMLGLEKNLADFQVASGTAECFFRMLSELGVLQVHRLLNFLSNEPDAPVLDPADKWLVLLEALARVIDPAEKEKAFEIIKAPRWLPVQPALALNLAYSMLKDLWTDLGHDLSEEIFKAIARKTRAQAMLWALLVNAYASCPNRRIGEKGWELDSILTRWGHIDLIATFYEDWHSEVFVLAEAASSAPQKMLDQPELRAFLEKKYSGPCKYYILHSGKTRYEEDGVTWLNIAEFLKGLPERWKMPEKPAEQG